MRRFLFLLTLCCVIPSSSVEAQSQQPQQQEFGETVEVRLATVDVVVTTKNGQHVAGLSAADFELLVDGKPQPITGFEEITSKRLAPGSVVAAAAAAPPATTSQSPPVERRRNLILLIDLYSLDNQRRNEAIRALREFLSSSWTAGDQAMIALWNRELKIPLTFTSDLSTVERQLDEVMKSTEGGLARDRKIAEMRIRFELQRAEVGSGGAFAGNMQAAYNNGLESANSYADEQTKRATNFAGDIEELMRGVSGAQGKKVVVLVGENFPRNPGLGMFEFLNELFSPYSRLIRIRPAPMLAAGRTLYQLVPKVTSAANRHGVTLHTIFSGESSSETAAEQESSVSTIVQFAEFTNTAAAFGTLSRDTGGISLLGSRNFKLAAQGIGLDFDHHYTVIWRGSSDSRTQKIEVRTRDRSLVVRARREFVSKSLDQEIEDRVVSRLYQTGAADAPEVQVQAGKPVRAGRGKMKVPVEIVFPVSLLTLVPRESKQVGGFEVVVAASDGGNRLSETSRQAMDVSWEQNAMPPTVRYSVEVIVRSGGGAIAVAVVDRLSKTTWYKTVPIPGK